MSQPFNFTNHKRIDPYSILWLRDLVLMMVCGEFVSTLSPFFCLRIIFTFSCCFSLGTFSNFPVEFVPYVHSFIPSISIISQEFALMIWIQKRFYRYLTHLHFYWTSKEKEEIDVVGVIIWVKGNGGRIKGVGAGSSSQFLWFNGIHNKKMYIRKLELVNRNMERCVGVFYEKKKS